MKQKSTQDSHLTVLFLFELPDRSDLSGKHRILRESVPYQGEKLPSSDVFVGEKSG